MSISIIILMGDCIITIYYLYKVYLFCYNAYNYGLLTCTIITPCIYTCIGLNVLLSGQADEFGLAQVAHAMLIPVFVEALRPLKTTFPYPPNPSVYEGTYKVEGDGIGQLPNITIGTFNKHLVLSMFGVGYYLSYQDKYLFQVRVNLLIII